MAPRYSRTRQHASAVPATPVGSPASNSPEALLGSAEPGRQNRSQRRAHEKKYARLRRLVQNKQWEPAWQEARALLERDPADAPLHHVAGLIQLELGDLQAARRFLSRAATEISNVPSLYNTLGRVQLLLGDEEEASRAFARAKGLEPDASALLNLGKTLEAQGLLAQAISAYSDAFELAPNSSEIAGRIAALHMKGGSPTRAIDWAMRALATQTTLDWETGYTLASALHATNRYSEALDAYHSLSLVRPDSARVLTDLGTLCTQLGLRDRATRYFGRALELAPSSVKLRCALVHQQMYLHEWEDLADRVRQAHAAVRSSKDAASPFALLSLPTTTGDDLKLTAKAWVSQNIRGPSSSPTPTRASVSPSDADRRLRIGYLTCDYHNHATAYLMARMFELHDKSQFQIHMYEWDTEADDEMRSRLNSAIDVRRQIRGLADEQAAQLIRSDEIDILVDLKGHTRGSRLGIAAYRPAPIQLHHVGYPGTLGAPFIDYFVADSFVLPREKRDQFTEKIAYLPHCYQPTDATRSLTRAPTRAESGLPDEGIVFCCFNQSYKITPDVFSRWCQLLKDVPGSTLWLLKGVDASTNKLREHGAAYGVDPSRLVFAEHAPQQRHLARLRLADVFLDTLPVNAHTTASDALWAGIPVVTLPGETFVSRVAGSILTAAGLSDLIASDAEDYVHIARRLATDHDYLTTTKQRVDGARTDSPLFNSETYTRHIEGLYRQMWYLHVRGERPRHLTIDGPID